MVKAIALIKRKPGLSREEFISHYENVHVPLIIKHSTGLRRYVRNFIQPLADDEPPGYDCVTELWYEDVDAFKATISVWASEAGQAIRDDEDSFLDRNSISFFLVDERHSEILHVESEPAR